MTTNPPRRPVSARRVACTWIQNVDALSANAANVYDPAPAIATAPSATTKYGTKCIRNWSAEPAAIGCAPVRMRMTGKLM